MLFPTLTANGSIIKLAAISQAKEQQQQSELLRNHREKWS